MNYMSADEILLSVITPVTRQADKLQNLSLWLSSLNNKPVEVLLIHDKSDIYTGPQIEKLLAEINNKNIIYFEGNYGSPGSARNQGLVNATGKWLCFWDSDDLPMPEEALMAMQQSIDTDTDCIVANYNSVNIQNGKLTFNPLSSNYELQIALNPGIWRFLFRRSSLEGLSFSNLLMAEDQIFLAEYLRNETKIQISEMTTYTYYVGNSTSLTRDKRALNDLGLASKKTLHIMNKGDHVNLKIVGIMLARQIISGFKHGGMKCKLSVSRTLIAGLFISGTESRKYIVKGLYVNFRKVKYQ